MDGRSVGFCFDKIMQRKGLLFRLHLSTIHFDKLVGPICGVHLLNGANLDFVLRELAYNGRTSRIPISFNPIHTCTINFSSFHLDP